MFCLSIWKRSAATYRFIRAQILSIPSVSTLKRLQNRISLKTGINDSIKKRLSEAVDLMDDPKEKVALLMWDEVALSKHMDYDTKTDRVVGVEEWGSEFRTEKIGIQLLDLKLIVTTF